MTAGTKAIATMGSSAPQQIMTLDDMERLAERFVKSKLFGIQTVDQAVGLMALCQAKGIHPALAVERYHIIQGRHSMKAEAMLAEFDRMGGQVYWISRNERECKAKFVYKESEMEVSWTMEMAKSAGLAFKDNWKKHPRQMLHARCVSEGVRSTCPAACQGVYTPEEVMDFDNVPMDQVNSPAPKAAIPSSAPKISGNIEAPVVESGTVEGEIIEPPKKKEAPAPAPTPAPEPTGTLLGGGEPTPTEELCTKKQRDWINTRVKVLEWTPEQFQSALEKTFNVSRLEDLSKKKATGLYKELKAMCEKKQKEEEEAKAPPAGETQSKETLIETAKEMCNEKGIEYDLVMEEVFQVASIEDLDVQQLGEFIKQISEGGYGSFRIDG